MGQAAERIGDRLARVVFVDVDRRERRVLAAPAVLSRPLGELLCVMPGAEPDEVVAELLAGERWRLVTMDTGHWRMFSRPRKLAQILLDAAVE